jgi:hypothetical protein
LSKSNDERESNNITARGHNNLFSRTMERSIFAIVPDTREKRASSSFSLSNFLHPFNFSPGEEIKQK